MVPDGIGGSDFIGSSYYELSPDTKSERILMFYCLSPERAASGATDTTALIPSNALEGGSPWSLELSVRNRGDVRVRHLDGATLHVENFSKILT